MYDQFKIIVFIIAIKDKKKQRYMYKFLITISLFAHKNKVIQ